MTLSELKNVVGSIAFERGLIVTGHGLVVTEVPGIRQPRQHLVDVKGQVLFATHAVAHVYDHGSDSDADLGVLGDVQLQTLSAVDYPSTHLGLLASLVVGTRRKTPH